MLYDRYKVSETLDTQLFQPRHSLHTTKMGVVKQNIFYILILFSPYLQDYLYPTTFKVLHKVVLNILYSGTG